ncbi:hypothetical protein ElyMa_005678800 [Elysia marginata]|uniref:Uncharacterized protein n=1 Tax=Elysia marginata TaxID=1093978 RepID=A0AAV4FDX7_9GAST|nr:hypothetical protein ElyMa_005678800 [Elysia marginata]
MEVTEMNRATWRYLTESTCAAYPSPLVKRSNNCTYPYRVDRPEVTNWPLRPPLYHCTSLYCWSHFAPLPSSSGSRSVQLSTVGSHDCQAVIAGYSVASEAYISILIPIELKLHCILARLNVIVR